MAGAGIVCFFMGLMLASVNTSATVIWTSTGIALAAFILLGYYIWQLKKARNELEIQVHERTEVLTKDLTKSKYVYKLLERNNLPMQLLQKIAISVNEASTVNNAFQFVLNEICAYTRWPVGHVYPNAENFQKFGLSLLWHLDDPVQFAPFQNFINELNTQQGMVSPSHVLSNGKPAWIKDITRNGHFPGTKIAEQVGIKAVFTFPVLVGQKTVAVMEFFSREATEPDDVISGIMAQAGIQLGRMIERKQIEESLRSSQELTRLIIDSAQDAFVSMNPEGKIVCWNPRAESTFGWASREVIGRSLEEIIIPPRYHQAHRQWMQRFQLTGKGRGVGKRSELIVLHRNGYEFSVEFIVSAACFKKKRLVSAFLHDITERKKTRERLKRIEERFRLLVEGVKDYAIYLLDPEGYVVSWNTGAERIHGYTSGEIIGRHFSCFYSQKDIQHNKPAHVLKETAEKGRFEEKDWKLRKDKTCFWANTVTTAMRNQDGTLTGFSKVTQDLTERMLVEEELTRSNTELEQFAYIAFHDLQEPLRMVHTYTQLLAKRYKNNLDKDTDEMISFVLGGVTRMKTLLNDLLDFSRVGKAHSNSRMVDSETILKQTLANLKTTMEENHARVTYDSLPAIQIDSTELLQLFQNLISNAIKFRTQEPPRIHISVTQQKKEWVFAVRDNGIGINHEYHERIFVIFQRLHGQREYPGTGIGLAICKKIVQNHGGRIWVESRLGSGSTFYFTMPQKCKKRERADLKKNRLPELQMQP